MTCGRGTLLNLTTFTHDRPRKHGRRNKSSQSKADTLRRSFGDLHDRRAEVYLQLFPRFGLETHSCEGLRPNFRRRAQTGSG